MPQPDITREYRLPGHFHHVYDLGCQAFGRRLLGGCHRVAEFRSEADICRMLGQSLSKRKDAFLQYTAAASLDPGKPDSQIQLQLSRVVESRLAEDVFSHVDDASFKDRVGGVLIRQSVSGSCADFAVNGFRQQVVHVASKGI